MIHRHAAVAAALLGACIASSHATVVAVVADGQWNTFNVSDIDSTSFGVEWIDNNNTLSPDFGTPLSFSFTVAAGFKATLTVVDAGFAGDTFKVTDFGAVLGSTSAVPAQIFDTAPDLGIDFDAALANPSFSRGVFGLSAGTYSISGMLDQSVGLDANTPLNSTVGALKLAVAPAVPEPSTWSAVIAGLALIAFMARRHGR